MNGQRRHRANCVPFIWEGSPHIGAVSVYAAQKPEIRTRGNVQPAMEHLHL